MVTVVSTVTVRVRVSVAVAVGIPVAVRISVAVVIVGMSGVSLGLGVGSPLAIMTVAVVRRVGSMSVEGRAVTVVSAMAVVDVSVVAVVAGVGIGGGIGIGRPLVQHWDRDRVGNDGSRTLRKDGLKYFSVLRTRFHGSLPDDHDCRLIEYQNHVFSHFILFIF